MAVPTRAHLAAALYRCSMVGIQNCWYVSRSVRPRPDVTAVFHKPVHLGQLRISPISERRCDDVGVERPIDFFRPRLMHCRVCDHRWTADLDWLERWNQAATACPSCDTDCQHEDGARATVRPGDAALVDADVPRLHWYHTSTAPDWPSANFDPAAKLTEQGKQRMGGAARVAAWAARQRAKALHLGTYEAAVHNMLRRMSDQDDGSSKFYLYRVHLRPEIVVRSGWLVDPSNFVGDVVLAEVCPPGIDVARYLNYHEDEGGISLALGRDAILAVQRVAVPLPEHGGGDWVQRAASAVTSAPEPPPQKKTPGRLQLYRPTPRAAAASAAVDGLSRILPPNLRDHFDRATALQDSTDPAVWAWKTKALFDLILDSAAVLKELDNQPLRRL